MQFRNEPGQIADPVRSHAKHRKLWINRLVRKLAAGIFNVNDYRIELRILKQHAQNAIDRFCIAGRPAGKVEAVERPWRRDVIFKRHRRNFSCFWQERCLHRRFRHCLFHDRFFYYRYGNGFSSWNDNGWCKGTRSRVTAHARRRKQHQNQKHSKDQACCVFKKWSRRLHLKQITHLPPLQSAGLRQR